MKPFEARLVRIIDGDTIVIETRCRLRNSAPEKSTPEGKRRTQILQDALPTHSPLTVFFHGVDQYDRPVVTVRAGRPQE